MTQRLLAPELDVIQWLNCKSPIALSNLRGKVILIEAFQMLCPGCVNHSLPQAKRVVATFRREDVAVIGLHTVFEHHQVQGTSEALSAFIHEYRIPFPVGIDRPSLSGSLPITMLQYGMQGTPTQLLIDRQGYLRRQAFGALDDLALGAEIATLVAEAPIHDSVLPMPHDGNRPRQDGNRSMQDENRSGQDNQSCTDDGCLVGGA